jgi:SAM-dependent methyltransferase
MLRQLARTFKLPGSRRSRSGAGSLGGTSAAGDDAVHWRAERAYWHRQLTQWMQARYNLGLDRVQEDDATVPDQRLAARIQNSAKAHPDVYFATGYRTVLDYLRELTDHGFAPERFESILEFGVGLGRLIRHFVPFRCHKHGCDVTPEVLDFTRQALGQQVTLAPNDLLPPLPYAEGSFDFLYANSVFTHIQMAATPLWIDELRRVLRPGGVGIVTVFEANRYLAHVSPRQFDEFECGSGYFEWGDDSVNHRFLYMTPHKLVATWRRAFEVLELRPRFREQSHLIVKRV